MKVPLSFALTVILFYVLIYFLLSRREDKDKKIVSGNPEKIKKIYDTWVFSRDMRSNNPNWQLVDILT